MSICIILLQLVILPNQELSGAKSELQGRTVGVCYERNGQPPIIYLRPTFGLHHEACKYVYLLILISETPTNRKYEKKMHIEVRKTIFLRSFQ